MLFFLFVPLLLHFLVILTNFLCFISVLFLLPLLHLLFFGYDHIPFLLPFGVFLFHLGVTVFYFFGVSLFIFVILCEDLGFSVLNVHLLFDTRFLDLLHTLRPKYNTRQLPIAIRITQIQWHTERDRKSIHYVGVNVGVEHLEGLFKVYT
jgi:hypothetical protein